MGVIFKCLKQGGTIPFAVSMVSKHWVEPFDGQRLSFVFFSVSKYWKTKPSVLAELRKRDFPLPSAEWMSHAEILLPQPRSYGTQQLPRMKSLLEMFGQPPPRKVVKRQVPSEASPAKNQPSVIAMLLASKSQERSPDKVGRSRRRRKGALASPKCERDCP